MALYVKKLVPEAKLPVRGTKYSAGLDLFSVEDILLENNKTKLISTGLSMSIPEGYVGQIWGRSSLECKGVQRMAGIIDSDYRGEVKVALRGDNYQINSGDKIAQIIIIPIYVNEAFEVDSLDITDRGAGGFGSTGK